MDSNFDDINNDMFDNTDNQLPENLDWDNVEAGILSKMEELEAEETKKYTVRNRNLFILSLVLLSLLSVGTFMNYQNSNSSKTQSEIGLTILDNEESKSLYSNSSEPTFSSTQSDFNLENNTLDLETESLVEKNNTFSSLNEDEKSFTNRADKKQNLSNNNGIVGKVNQQNQLANNVGLISRNYTSDLEQVEFMENGVNNSFTTTISTDQNVFTEQTATVSSIKSVGETMSIFENLNIDYSSIPSINTPFLTLLRSSSIAKLTPSRKKKLKKGTSNLTAFGGVSTWNSGYGSAKSQRAEFERSRISYNAGINYNYITKKNFNIMIGIQYQQLESRFDWNTIIPDYQITLKDTIVEISTNVVSGETTEIRGDVDLSVSAERNVIHFNRSRIFQIPVAVGKTWYSNSRKWQADILAGGSINIVSNQTGRTLYMDDVVTFSGSDNDFMNAQFKFNALLSGRLTYRLNSNIGIMTGFQFQKSLSNWSTEENILMRPGIMNLNIGMTYVFPQN